MSGRVQIPNLSGVSVDSPQLSSLGVEWIAEFPDGDHLFKLWHLWFGPQFRQYLLWARIVRKILWRVCWFPGFLWTVFWQYAWARLLWFHWRLFCRAYALNLTSCASQFNLGTCLDCQVLLQYCPALALSDFTADQVDIACDYDSSEFCDPFFVRPDLCQYDDYSGLCDLCNGFRSICNQPGSGLPPICFDEVGVNCSLTYNYFPCYVSAGEDESSSCDLCGAVVELCPNLRFDRNYVPPEVCDSEEYVSSCSLIANDIFCSRVYGDVVCNYCMLVNEECPVLNSSAIVEALDESCLTEFPNCMGWHRIVWRLQWRVHYFRLCLLHCFVVILSRKRRRFTKLFCWLQYIL